MEHHNVYARSSHNIGAVVKIRLVSRRRVVNVTSRRSFDALLFPCPSIRTFRPDLLVLGK